MNASFSKNIHNRRKRCTPEVVIIARSACAVLGAEVKRKGRLDDL